MLIVVMLLIVEILFLVQLNLSRGLKQKTIIEIIENTNIQEELKEQEEYKELRKINPVLAEEIIKSDEFEKYFKENIKSLYTNLIYNENRKYVQSDNLKDFIRNKLEEYQSENFTQEQKEIMLNKTNSIIYEIDNILEEVNNEDIGTKTIRTILSKTTSYILLIGPLLIAVAITMINRTKESLIWIGIPTTISGLLFFMLFIELRTNVSVHTIYEKLITDINSTLKTSSIATIIIGFALIILYALKKIQKESEQNGEI